MTDYKIGGENNQDRSMTERKRITSQQTKGPKMLSTQPHTVGSSMISG